MYLLYLHTKAVIRIAILISKIYFIVDINMNGIGLERKSSISMQYPFTVYDEFSFVNFYKKQKKLL